MTLQEDINAAILAHSPEPTKKRKYVYLNRIVALPKDTKKEKLLHILSIQALFNYQCCPNHCPDEFTQMQIVSCRVQYALLNKQQKTDSIRQLARAAARQERGRLWYEFYMHGKSVCGAFLAKVNHHPFVFMDLLTMTL